MVVRIDDTAGSFYVCYAIDGPDYFYVYGTFSATGRLQLQIAINRGGVLTAGTAADLFVPNDIAHVLTFIYDGTSAGTRIRVDGGGASLRAEHRPGPRARAGTAGCVSVQAHHADVRNDR